MPCSRSVIVDVERVRRKRRVAAPKRREEHRTNLSAMDSNMMRSGYHWMDKQKFQLTPVRGNKCHARGKSIALIGHVDVRVAQDGRGMRSGEGDSK